MRRRCGFIMLTMNVCLLLGGCFLTPHDPTVTMSIEPSSGYSPLTVHLEAHATETDGLSYLWEFADGTTAIEREVDHEFSGTGQISVRLTTTDTQGRQTITESAVRLLNRLPHAQFTFHPNPAPTHHPVVFDARGSYDSDGEIVSYNWDFGDGSEASGALVEHSFELPGLGYRVILTVTDDAGGSNTMYRDIELIGCDH